MQAIQKERMQLELERAICNIHAIIREGIHDGFIVGDFRFEDILPSAKPNYVRSSLIISLRHINDPKPAPAA
jgi:hypothetical protein